MAEVTGSGSVSNQKYWKHEWETLTNGDTGAPARPRGAKSLTVQVLGTFGASGEVTMQGSLDGTNWFTLEDEQGNGIVISSAGSATVSSQVEFVRPNVTNGDGTTDLDVFIGGSVLF